MHGERGVDMGKQSGSIIKCEEWKYDLMTLLSRFKDLTLGSHKITSPMGL